MLTALKFIYSYIVALVVGIVMLPLLIPLAIYKLLFGVMKDRSAEDVVDDLECLLSDDVESDHAWDNLESVPFEEPRLEAIRKEALSVATPLDEAGRAVLAGLLVRAKALGEGS